VQSLVKEDALEFVNGGWVQNDEATVQYEDILKNHIIGSQFLK
jgi:hypothetical protein